MITIENFENTEKVYINRYDQDMEYKILTRNNQDILKEYSTQLYLHKYTIAKDTDGFCFDVIIRQMFLPHKTCD